MDGRVSAIVGTHTHIQTADEKILPEGTAHITDLGMTGPYDSVIGQNKENIIHRFLTSRPIRFSVAHGDVKLHGAVIDPVAEPHHFGQLVTSFARVGRERALVVQRYLDVLEHR